MICEHKGPANMDHIKGYPPDHIHMTSRMCMKCGWHLYGPRGDEREYTRAEWDSRINSTFDGERFELEQAPLPDDLVQLTCQAVAHLKRRGVID